MERPAAVRQRRHQPGRPGRDRRHFGGLQRHVTESAARGIYRVIGSEEAAIRANPRQTGDPVLIGVFGMLG